MKISKTQKLVECAIMVALATVLSLFKLVDMPYGGSVTPASMLPVIVIAYRHGASYGFGSALVFAVLQQLLGLENLSYVSGWMSVVALILLDYILAYVVAGFGGAFRNTVKKQSVALALGATVASLGRFLCHFLSGITVWTEFGVPTGATIAYSLGYNASYMIPETLVVALAAFYVGGLLDLRAPTPRRLPTLTATKGIASYAPSAAWLLIVGALIFDVSAIFAHLQDAESGEFLLAGLAQVNWIAVAIVSAVAAALATALLLYAKKPSAQES